MNLFPRITIAALKGGSGKTMLSLGLSALWRRRGRNVATFKKGPDFIDAGWLAFATGRPCHNLDPFMMEGGRMLASFLSHSAGADISLIEGNRGLFDGLDLEGHCSTAELVKLLKCPVVLLVDVTMSTRTVAALVMGCQRFDPDLEIAAVILNRVAGARQESLIRNAIERYCGISVVGAVPRLTGDFFPERHMGLVPHQESRHAEKTVSWAMSAVEDHLDLDALWRLAHEVKPLEDDGRDPGPRVPDPGRTDAPRIGFVRDASFWFYYPENLSQLERLGAVLVELNAMTADGLPDLDALYIGGGFPETQAEALSRNEPFRADLREKIEAGLPVYAECGGLMYLGERLVLGDRRYPMVGALPLEFVLEKRPQGHGYTVLEVDRENPFYPAGETLKGHEFHYSRPIVLESRDLVTVFRVRRGRGLDGKRDGLCRKNLLATYSHMHAAGSPLWAEGLFKAALRRSAEKVGFFEGRSK